MKILVLGEKEKNIFDGKDWNVEKILEPYVENIHLTLITKTYDVIVANFDYEDQNWHAIAELLIYKFYDLPIISSSDFFHKFNLEANPFFEIDIFTVKKCDILPVDLFLPLSPKKNVKIISANNLFSHSLIEKLIDKGIKKLLVVKDDFPKLSEYLLTYIEKDSTLNNENIAKNEFNLNKISIAQDLVRILGLTQNTVEILNKTVDEAIALVEECDELSTFLRGYVFGDRYLSGHSVLLSHLCCLSAAQLGWNTQSTLQKLSIASLLHDVTFSDEEIARIDSLEEAKLKFPEYVYGIKMHPLHISRMVSQAKNMPPHVDKIILSHHEQPDGSGFPKGSLANSVTQLECLFIIVHAFVNAIYGKEITKDLIAEVVSSLEVKYLKGNYRAPMIGVSKLFYSI